MDNAPLAKLTKGKYFAVVIPTDAWVTAHVQITGQMSNEIQIKPVADKTLFIRVYGGSLFGRGGPRGSLLQIDGPDVRKAMKNVVPEDPKNVHAADRVCWMRLKLSESSSSQIKENNIESTS